MQNYEWHRRFREGRESATDDERSGRPQTSRTAENVEKFSAAVRHQFQSADEVKSGSLAELKDMVKNGFQKCFDKLYKLWQKCAVAHGSYFEGGCVSAI
ncbi:hypothetical protein TNCV_1321021 [Trichonephila clavipes]|nr:hypothetical protein TNCV_1321021 [Trichonephila clavipes]